MRVKYKYAGFRRRSAGSFARMSLMKGELYTYYYGSDTALATINQWPNGVSVELEIDDDTGQPLFLYLTPATSGGLPLKKPPTGRPLISLSTRELGLADLEPAPIQAVEETVTPTEIKIGSRSSFAARIRLPNN
jgi:hypothetical protein